MAMDSPSSIKAEQGDQTQIYQAQLSAHTSKLPNWLYILSFSPPYPRNIKAFITHPHVLYAVGTVAALGAGVGLPAFDMIFGWWSNGIRGIDASRDSIIQAGRDAGWVTTVVGVVFAALFALFVVCFSLAGIKSSNYLREQYLSAVLVQDQAFFDRVGPGEIISRANKDIDSIRTGLGERLGYLVWSASTIITAFVSAFVYSPKLAGVLFALIPFTMGVFTVLGYWAESTALSSMPIDGKASTLIEQTISSVRIVQAFDMGPRLLGKLEHGMLRPLKHLAKKQAFVKALGQGAAYGAAFLVYSMCFWYGGISVQRGLSVGSVLVTFYNYVNLFFSFAGIVPHLVATTTAIQNISNLRLQIERQPLIDPRDTSGLKLGQNTGWTPSFALDNVTFAYPSRPAQKVLDGLSVMFDPGKFTALVGPSGSGKSTLASLLLRHYDPQTATQVSELDKHILKTMKEANGEEEGERSGEGGEAFVDGGGVVTFAGHDVRLLNTRWLRSQVAVVLQNPQVISGTIFENVAAGLTGTEWEYRADIDGIDSESKGTRLGGITEKVKAALIKAEAWDFVNDLPEGLQTRVSAGRTGVLSGGQVQRIALATALVREPKCLLLDEATSAISADAEMKIMARLLEEQRSSGMTLIVIAHRLSTIVHADNIVVMVAGRAVQSGTYDQLLEPDCPDQTFRSMALAIPLEATPRRGSLDDARSTHTLTQLNERHDNTESDLPLPPPMTSTWNAFSHVKYLLIIGVILGAGAGAGFVIAAWIHGRAVNSLNSPDLSLMRSQVDRWALWFLVLAIANFVVMVIHASFLEYSGESIVGDLRRESVRALIRQDIAFFEFTKQGSGSLTAAATTHPGNVGNVIGLILAQVVSSSANITATVIMAFVLNWHIAVMIIPGLFVTMLLGLANFIASKRFEADIAEENDRQADFIGESINTSNMLSSLTREAETIRLFKLKFTARPITKKWLLLSGCALGLTQAMVLFAAALLVYWSAEQLAQGNVGLADVFTVQEALIVSCYIGAKILTYTGDFTRMKNSLNTIQGWIDRVPAMSGQDDIYEKGKTSGSNEKAEGIVFKDVELRYPSRPGVLALDKVNLHLEPGRSYAFCGTSGAGKSSILAVLQRFYDITSGSVFLDGEDINNLDVRYLRNQMGYVSQEPLLFEETVRWNLISGAVDPSSITDADLEFACEQACILSFIKTLPLGFETDLGVKGGQLSGGQRQVCLRVDDNTDDQRLCIARVLLRKPRILLLDEATSALDGKSEASVQQALDNATKGRTTITIAHRLSTIRKADVIFVMEQGRVVETGGHEDLLNMEGRYFDLVQAQL